MSDLNIQILKVQKEGNIFFINGTTSCDNSYKVFKYIGTNMEMSLEFAEIVPKFSLMGFANPVLNEIDINDICEEEFNEVFSFCTAIIEDYKEKESENENQRNLDPCRDVIKSFIRPCLSGMSDEDFENFFQKHC